MRFVIRRLGLFLITLWAALTINFLIPRLMPGNEATAGARPLPGSQPGGAPRARGRVRRQREPEHAAQRTSSTSANCVTGQFGLTASRAAGDGRDPQGLPWTLALVGVTTVIAFVIGTMVGVVSAWRRGGTLDSILSPLLFILTTFPVFFIGLLLLFVFGVILDWFPLTSNYRWERRRRSRSSSSGTSSSTRSCPASRWSSRPRAAGSTRCATTWSRR